MKEVLIPQILVSHYSHPNVFLLVNIFHANLHQNAMFSAAVLRRLSPPFSLGVHMLSHATEAIPFSVLLFSKRILDSVDQSGLLSYWEVENIA